MCQKDPTPLMALSLLQPWATLLALGLKKVETRSWRTDYRGPIAIQASLGRPDYAKFLSADDIFFQEALAKSNLTFDALPRGCIVAVAELVDCLEIVDAVNNDAESSIALNPGSLSVSEIVFGDYSPGRYAWVFERVNMLASPVICRGALSLWRVPPDVQAEIIKQVT